MTVEATNGEFTISTDRDRLDLNAVHSYLVRSYWAEGVPREILRKAVAESLCFGLYRGAEQIGFARVVTDRATFAYLCDVYVLEAFRGRGLGKWLMQVVMEHPHLQGLRRFVLVTRDAHELYRPLGFTSLANPTGYMEIHKPGIYLASDGAK